MFRQFDFDFKESQSCYIQLSFILSSFPHQVQIEQGRNTTNAAGYLWVNGEYSIAEIIVTNNSIHCISENDHSVSVLAFFSFRSCIFIRVVCKPA